MYLVDRIRYRYVTTARNPEDRDDRLTRNLLQI